ncbi:MAG: M48 family metallopeptidase [Candidatus Thermoplasmatota archaeon]|jgi:predicted metal-dependent hydrolase|nr:M48 family metallopeptidase [Candidatus Thermoplasmatota archaeon]
MNDIEIKRSKRRKKTVEARFVKNKLVIYLPEGMNKSDEKKWINKMIKWGERRKTQKKLNKNKQLLIRSQKLSKKYFNGKLDFSIKFVSNQKSRFGSCSIRTKSIRISDKLAKVPQWVLDYVIIHEIAHLIYPNHSNKFWEKVNQYKYAERARGYLIAMGMLSEDKS